VSDLRRRQLGVVAREAPAVIVGQIHAADLTADAFVMLGYEAGALTVVVKQDQTGFAHTDYPLLGDVPLGTRFDFGLTDEGNGSLAFTASSARSHRYWDGAGPTRVGGGHRPLPSRPVPAGRLGGRFDRRRRRASHLLRARDVARGRARTLTHRVQVCTGSLLCMWGM
jgi:hypothetical protein